MYRAQGCLAPRVGLLLGLILGLPLAPAILAARPADCSQDSPLPPPERCTAVDQEGRRHLWLGQPDALTVIDFAATWCVPCRRTLPRLQSLADRHPELEVLVVSVDDTAAQRDRLVEELGLTLPVLWDEGHRIAEHYHPEAMPATLLLDASGREIHRHTGSGDEEWARFVAIIEERLAASPEG